VLPEVSRYQAYIGATWHPLERATLRADVRFASSQFDDDLNTRRLAGYGVVNLYAETAITQQLSIYAEVQNLLDRTIEAGKAVNGVVTVGTPRVAAAGVRLSF
jgi:outer membrane receptor protein involved in Fe transport